MSDAQDKATLTSIQRRLDREKRARHQAEKLLTEKSVALFDALQQSKQSENRLKLALWSAQEAFWEWNARDDTFTVRSYSFKTLTESQSTTSAFDLLRRVHEDDISQLEFQWALVLHGGQEKLEIPFRYLAGTDYLWIRLRGRVLERDNFNSALRMVGTARDITTEREAEQTFHLMASAFASSREPMLVLSGDYKVTECNDAFKVLMRMDDKMACLGLSLSQILQDATPVVSDPSQKQVRFETRLMLAKGLTIPVDVSLAKFESEHQKKPYIIVTIRDISERKQNETRLRQLALFDDLTGLLNRNGLNEFINRHLASTAEFAVMFIDLDGFKQINDGAGHEKGDISLREVAKILGLLPSKEKLIARWGGDEFVLVLPHCDIELANRLGEAAIARIEELIIHSQNTELRLSASIGVAMYPHHGDTIERLIQNADAAMYQAKTSGKGQVSIYQLGLWESMKAQVSLLSELRKAVDHKGLEFYVQGKYSLNGRLVSGELLCRWFSTVDGAISPAIFIPLAEKHKLDFKIGLMALERACEYLQHIIVHDNTLTLAVNISANQLLDPAFPSQAMAICQQHNVPSHRIEIELTESIFLKDQAQAIEALNALRRLGFELALDDFGSGFSALSYLRMFAFSTVKLDRSLLKDIHHDDNALALFRGIIHMLHALKIRTVVEGVELSDYLPILRAANVDLLQGFYFDKPMPFDDFRAKLPVPTAIDSGQ